MSAKGERGDRFDRRKVAAGLGISALIHVAVIGGVAFGDGVMPDPEFQRPADFAETPPLELVRIAVPTPEAVVPTTATPAPAAAAASAPGRSAAILARVMEEPGTGMASIPALAPSNTTMSSGALSHVSVASAEGLWDEYDEWAEGLVNRRTDDSDGVGDWFAALQGAARPACGPPILINR